MLRNDHLELSKSEFVGVLKDAGILIGRKEDKKDDGDTEGKKKAAQANTNKPAEAKKPDEE
jgi:hypothetical protein